MQPMSTDPQSYYNSAAAASHQPQNNYYIPNNGMEPPRKLISEYFQFR